MYPNSVTIMVVFMLVLSPSLIFKIEIPLTFTLLKGSVSGFRKVMSGEGFIYRLATTLFGIVATDYWKVYSYNIHHKYRGKSITMISFTFVMSEYILINIFKTYRRSV